MPDQHGAARVVVASGQVHREIPLGEHLAVGRSPDGELVLEEFDASRYHAEIRQIGDGQYRIRDLGSLNGTFVNGQRIHEPRALFHGDEIRIGTTTLRFIAPGCVRDIGEGDTLVQLDAPAHGAEPAAAGAAERASAEHAAAREELRVALGASIRSYGSLAEKLPRESFSAFIRDWRQACADRVRERGGLSEDAADTGVLLASWQASTDPAGSVERALLAAREVLLCAAEWKERFAERFDVGFFDVGVGVHWARMPVPVPVGGLAHPVGGLALSGAGSAALQLAELCKEKGYPLLVSRDVADRAKGQWGFVELGAAALEEGVSLDVLAVPIDA